MRMKHLSIEERNPFICSAEAGDGDDGPDGGPGGDDNKDDKKDTPPDFAKMFTDLSQTLSGAVASLKKDITEIKKSDPSKIFQEQITKLKEELSQNKEKQEEKKGGTPDEVFLRQQHKEMQDQLKLLQDQLSTERSAREVAEKARRDTEKDRILNSALVAADAIDPEFAASNFIHKIVFNEEENKFFYQDGDEQLRVEDGIKKYLPNYMKKAKSGSGGSGGRGPGADPPSGSKKAQLKEFAINLGIAAKKSNGQVNDVSKFQRAKREALNAGVEEQEIVSAVNSAS
jgi:hypothetical protein